MAYKMSKKRLFPWVGPWARNEYVFSSIKYKNTLYTIKLTQMPMFMTAKFEIYEETTNTKMYETEGCGVVTPSNRLLALDSISESDLIINLSYIMKQIFQRWEEEQEIAVNKQKVIEKGLSWDGVIR